MYGGEERVKRLFRRALIEDKLSVKVYEIAQKPKNERQPFYNRLASQFAEGNYFSLELSLKVVGSLVTGLTGEVLEGAQPESQNRLIQVGDVRFEMVYVEGGTLPAHTSRGCAVRDGLCRGRHVPDGGDGGARGRCV